jgi:uncharacterized phiE125 gp8 family phage protein
VRRWPYCPDPALLRIPVEPVDAVTGITYRDADGATQALAGTEFEVTYEDGRATIAFNGTFTSPSLYLHTSNPITVAFNAGYDWPHDGTGTGSDPVFVLDDRLRIVVLMLMAHWFENRGIVRVGEQIASIEATADSLLAGLDVFGT